MSAGDKVESLSQYLEKVETIREDWSRKDCRVVPWFRGQKEGSWPLQPRFFRSEFEGVDEDDFRFEFKQKSGPFLIGQARHPQTEWDWYFLMQHYGLPTRLLDWSEGALVALYFAVRDAEQKDKPAVWLLNPYALNRASKVNRVLTAGDRKVKPFLHDPYTSSRKLPEKPLAIQPAYNSYRISSQRGLFTIHGRDQRPLEDYPFLKGSLVKIQIEPCRLRHIYRQLDLAGISERTLFPELSSLCRDIVSYWKGA